MGILKHLLFWPYTGPKFLFDFAIGKVEGVVREELTDDTPIKAELLELQLMLELGDITDEEYVEREAAVMLRFREIRQWREEFGMGVSGGPVRVADTGGAEPETDEPETDEPQPAPQSAPQSAPEPAAEDQPPMVARPDEVTIELNFDEWRHE